MRLRQRPGRVALPTGALQIGLSPAGHIERLPLPFSFLDTFDPELRDALTTAPNDTNECDLQDDAFQGEKSASVHMGESLIELHGKTRKRYVLGLSAIGMIEKCHGAWQLARSPRIVASGRSARLKRGAERRH